MYSLDTCLAFPRRSFREPPTGLFSGESVVQLMGLNDVILKACEIAPQKRFRNAESMQRALEDLRALGEPSGRP